MSPVRVKICGITRPEDAEAALYAGADAIGMVFYQKSSRYVSDLGLAREIALSAGPFVTVVALVVDAQAEFIDTLLAAVPVDSLQFHGNETAAFCDQFKRPYIKALRMQEGLDATLEICRYPGATGFLLDAYKAGVPGGTGESFDWSRFPKGGHRSLILAGGLSPQNVAEAIRMTRPYAVDVSGGVEASPGIKDPNKIAAFIQKVRSNPTE